MNNTEPFPGWNGFAACTEAFWKAACAGLLVTTLGVLVARSAESPKPPESNLLKSSYASIPLAFEQDHGQANPAIKFLARGNGYAVFFTEKDAVISLERRTASSQTSLSAAGFPGRGGVHKNTQQDVLRLQWAGANPAPRIEGVGKETGRSNYLIGNNPGKWIRGVPAWSKVEYHGVYPDTDIVYYGNQRRLEFDIDVAPGADPRAARLRISGENYRAVKLHINRSGELVVHTRAGEVLFKRPCAYQPGGHSGNGRHALEVRYVIEKAGMVGFEVCGYDPAKPLVIDPVLSYSTYLGGTDYNYATGVAVDASGNTYITGYTSSVDFPVSGGVQGIFAGGSCDTNVNTAPCFDAFVSKLNPQGTGLIYSTYLGGSGDDRGVRIAVDSTGEAYVAGYTDSTDFPTASPLQGSNGGGTCGTTAYPDPCYDAFVAKLTASGSNLVYSTYLGGTGDDFASSIAVDSSGNAYVGGLTSAANFPVIYGAFQTAYGGGPFDGFVAKINPLGTALVYSTYLGGSQEDHVKGLALDSSGAAYVTGWTTSKDFPVTEGAFDTTWGGTNEIFVAKIAPAGNAIDYATYLGGINPNQANAIAVDGSGNAWIAGFAYGGEFPAASPLQAVSGGLYDAIVSEFDAADSNLLFSTYLGGTGDEAANDLALDSSGNIYVAGDTFSTDFPITSSAVTTDYTGGSYDAWIARISPQNAAGLAAVPNPLAFAAQQINTTSPASVVKVSDAGSAALNISGISVTGDFAETSQCGQTVSPGTQCFISVTFTPTATGARSGSLVISDSASGSPHTIHLSGLGASGAVTLSASNLDFGLVALGATSTQAVTLTNPAQSPLDISSIQAGGDYTETNNCGSVVNPGGSCIITVGFSPSALGTGVGTVTIADTSIPSPQTITLTGTGVPFTLSADPSSATVLAGTSQTQFTLSASAGSGFTGSVALGCADISPATCAFSPTAIAPGQSSTLTVGNLSAVTSSPLNFTVTGTAETSSTTAASTLTSTSSGAMTAMLPLSVQIEDFTLAVTPANASIQAGQTANFTLTLTPLNGFNLPVSLTCSGAPAGSTCSFTSSTVQLSPSRPVQSTLIVATNSQSLAYPPSGAGRPPGDGSLKQWFVFWLWCLPLSLMLIRAGRREHLPAAAAGSVFATVLLGLSLAACGGGAGDPSQGQNNGTPAGTYTLKVTATARSLTHTNQLTLQVK